MRVSDILAGGSRQCRACAARNKMAAMSPEDRQALAATASRAAAEAAKSRVDPLVAQYGPEAKRTLRAMAEAKQRCTNPNTEAYKNYGARGIEFRFASTRAAAEWVLANIGPRPTAGHSIDRIDNNRHYEPGNLRWATRTEQGQNKRAYKRVLVGERIRRLQAERPDVTYETLRVWIKAGLTDEEIQEREKYARTGV